MKESSSGTRSTGAGEGKKNMKTRNMTGRITATAVACAIAATAAAPAWADDPATPTPTDTGTGTSQDATPSTVWSVSDGAGATLTPTGDGSYAGQGTVEAEGDADPATPVASADGEEDVTLTLADTKEGEREQKAPGLATRTDTQTWTGTAKDGIKLTYARTVNRTWGKEVTVAGGHAFAKAADGSWTASISTGLSDQDEPDLSQVAADGRLSLSDGTGIPLDGGMFSATQTVTGTDGAQWRARTARATGTVATPDGTSTPVTVIVTASRVRDAHATPSVLRTKADGTTQSIPVDGWDPATDSYTLTLPHDAVADSYTLVVDAGPDATLGTLSSTLGQGSSRVLTQDINGRKVSVTVAFQAADIQPDSPARLDGIYVNATGDQTKGTLIDGWDPNRLDYTITVAKDAPSPFVLPEAGDGVTVATAGTTQTADGTRQAWTVTDKATGQTREYTVTVVRQRDYQTAAERFTPAQPAAQTPGAPSEDPADTSLESVGWTDQAGAYHAEDSDSFQIPEGGTFSYTARDGQSVSVSATRTTGMTWRYTVGVLAADGSTYAAHAYDVTYLTQATHTADITGIIVDGQPIGGFDPATGTYTVDADPNDWTLAADWDRTTGMTVTVDKHGGTGTITATSADGLVTRTWTVTATRNPLTLVQAAVRDRLPETGANVMGALGAMMALLAAAGATLLARRRHAMRGKHGATTIQ